MHLKLGAGVGGWRSNGERWVMVNALAEGIGWYVQSAYDHQYAGAEYENKIAEQNAQVEDLRNLPPSLQKQGNNPNMNLGYAMHGVRIRIKRILHNI